MDFKKFSVMMTALVCTSASAQTEWDNPTITSVNRETAHTVSLPMGSEADAAKNDLTLSPYYQSLDGKWKFYWVNTPSKATEAMCAKTYNDDAWTNIDVPSSWQVWGLHNGKSWDKPLYCNVAYPFSFNETTFSVMANRPSWVTYNSNMPNPVGTYRRTFTISADWLDGHEVYARFNGVGHGFYLWINGQVQFFQIQFFKGKISYPGVIHYFSSASISKSFCLFAFYQLINKINAIAREPKRHLLLIDDDLSAQHFFLQGLTIGANIRPFPHQQLIGHDSQGEKIGGV